MREILRRLLVCLRLDSLPYKARLKGVKISDTGPADFGRIDGYKEEGEAARVNRLVGLILSVVPEPAAVLDIGCGTGRYLKRMSELLPRTHFEGIDMSAEIVAQCTRPLLPRVPIHVLDIERARRFVRQNRQRFDLVCLIGIVQLLAAKKIKPVFKKVYRLCAAGGTVYVQFNVETAEKRSGLGYRRYSIGELEGMLVSCGFTIARSGRTDILRDYAYIFAQKPGGRQLP